MSMKKNTARRVLGTAMLAAGVLLFTACPREIGLGRAVDTAKPAITISTPEADSVVKGTITLTGTVTDDLAVKSVTVTFASTSQPSLASKSYPATVNTARNTWSLVVNSTDAVQGLPDSNYEIIATASDTTNKTSSATRSFQLDNTAPTVLITSPSLYGTASNRTKFCSQLEIKGEAYDASKIQNVKVYLCNASGTVVAGPLTADGTNTWSAMFTGSDLTNLADNTIYYFYAVATDESGNSNTTFYHKADIYGQLPQNSSFPSMNDIGHLDQGTQASASCQLSASALRSIRIGTGASGIAAKKDTATGYPDFTYQQNADAAILWTNLGDGDDGVIGVNTAIFATIQPPSDNSAILMDSIEIKIRAVNGEWITQGTITKQKVGESVNISVSPKSSGGSPMQDGTYDVNLICNTNSNSQISDTKRFSIQSDAPQVEESSVGNGNTAFAQGIISTNSTVTGLSGKFLLSSGGVIAPSTITYNSFVISCKDSTGATYGPADGYHLTDGGGITYNDADGSWSLAIPVGSASGAFADDTYTFTISGTLGEALTTITRVVTVDTTIPEVNLVSPTADSCISIATNGSGLTLQGTAMDTGSGINTTYWVIDEAGNTHTTTDSDLVSAAVLGENAVPVKGTWYKFSTPTVFNLSPNMSGYEQKDYKVWIFTKDNAGYLSSPMSVVQFFIDNEAPGIAVSTAEWPAQYLQAFDADLEISGTAWDSSGSLGKVTVSFDGGAAVDVKDFATDSSNGTYTDEAHAAAWTFDYSDFTASLPSGWADEGTHSIAFSVKDKAGRVSNTVSKTFIVDATEPVVSVANLQNGARLENMDTPISGTAIDALSGIDKVEYSTDEGVHWSEATNASGAWSINLSSINAESNMKIRIRGIDRAGNEAYAPATGDIEFFIDKSNPVATLIVTSSGSRTEGQTVMTRNSFILSGEANDGEVTPGRQADSVKLTYSKDGGTPVTAFDVNATGTNWNRGTDASDGQTGKWNWTMPDGFAEGFYTFTLTVKDSADKTTTVTQSIRYDHTAPVLVVSTPAANEPFATASIAMSGNVSDSGCGVNKLYYTLDGTDPTETSDSITPTGNSWTETVTFNEQGVHTLKIFAVDTLGNKTSVQTINFSRDDARPELYELNVTASGKTTNGNFKLAGVAWDTNELASISITDGVTTWTGTGAAGDDIALTKKTANPGADEENWNWSITFVTGSANAADSKYVADGSTTFTITATDVAGKTVSATRTVNVDTTNPAISDVTIANAMVKLDETVYDKLTVSASDSGTGLAGVYYQVLSTSSAPTFTQATEGDWTSLALGSASWTGNIDFSTDANKTEGTHYIFVAAKDNAGNRVVRTTPVSVVVDKQKPVLTVTGTENAGASNIRLNIVIDDTNPDEDELSVEVKKANGDVVGTLTPVAATAANTWEVTVPFSTAAYAADGLYSIYVNETDTRGRAATQVVHTIRKDTTAPAVNTIDSPAEGKTGTNALYGTSYLFRGTAKDIEGSTDCAGLAKILYAFTRTASAPAASAYTAIDMADGSWSVTKSFNAGDHADTGTDNLFEGTWYMYVIAEDKAGNRTSAVSRTFDIDMSNPELTFTTPSDITQTVYTKNGSYSLAGTASDTNGVQSLTVQVDDGTATPVTIASNGTWSYSVTRTNDNKDKLLSVKFVLTDIAGKTTEKTATLFFDTQAPSVTITLPAANETTSNNTYTLTGTVADTGIGVDTTNATYIIKKNGAQVASGALTVTGASWKAENASLGSAEGSLDLTVTIKDKLGQSTSVDRTFYYDLNKPELREAAVTASGLTTNADFQLAGTAWDTNELDCITVSDGTNTWTSAGVSPTVSLVKKTSDPGSAVSDRNWHIDFGVGSSTSGIHLNDGTTTFTITAKDVAGKTVSVTRTVTVDTTVPTVSTASVENALVCLDESKYDRLTVTAADDGGTGLAGVYYQIVASTASAPTFTSANESSWSPLALGSSGWTGNADFTGKAEGAHKIYVAAKDNAENRTVYGTALTATVDAKKPVITITGPADAGAGNVALVVRVTDTNPVAPVITVLDTDGDAISVSDAGISSVEGTATASYKEWNVTVPFGRTAYGTDGVYTIVVNETDTRSRAADEVTHEVRKDVSAPTATIDSPATGKTGVNSLYGESFLFRGTATDNTGGSGIAKILYAFSRTSSAPAASAYTELAASDGTWSFSKTMNEGLSATATGNLYEGTWYLYILAEDKAGNRTATPVSRSFDIDMSEPVLTVTAPADLTQTAYTKNNTFAMSGTASDTNGVQSLTVQVGEATAVPVTVTNGAWSYTFSRTDSNKDQTLSAKVVLTDVAGKATEKTIPFFFDTQAPSVTITLPAANEITTTNTYTLSGTVADTGSGVNTTNGTYTIKKGSTTVASGSLVITGASWKAENVALGSAEGSLDLTISIKDKVAQTATVTRTFYYDKNLPVITETAVGSSLTTNAAFTFTGTASDTNALINDGTGAIKITATKDSGSTNVIDTTVDVAANGSWSKTFTPGSASGQLADGTYDFTITVTDAANRTKAITSSVVVDKVAPTVAKEIGKSSFLTDTPSATGSWFKKEYLGLKAVVSDNAGGSGISMVEYAVISNPASAPAAATWTGDTITWNTMTKGSAAYTASAQVAGGTNYICIRATDKAGNATYTTQETAKVDLRAPTITGIYTDAACTQALLNSTYKTNKKDLALYLKTSDLANTGTPELTGSGVSSLKVTINGHEVTASAVSGATNKYLLSVSANNLDSYLGDEGAYLASAVITDVAGNSTSVSQLFTIQYDNTPPVVAFTTPSAGATVNKTITVSGTTTEGQSLDTVKLYIVKNGTDTELEAFTGNDRFNWTYTLNTFDNTDHASTYVATSGSMTLKVVAKDAAGNTATETCTFTVDQSKDCPEITINNIAFSGMTSAAPKWLIGSKTIYGSVTDDDGNIKKLEISTDGTNWTEVTVNNGSFTQNLNTDGKYTILFRVKDKNDTVFTTADATVLARPVLKGSDASTAADNKLYLTVDTTNPNADVPDFSFDGSAWDRNLLANNTFGGLAEHNTFYVRQYVYDANGIEKVEVSIGSGAYVAATVVTDASSQPVTKTIGGVDYTAYQYQVTTAQIAAAASGNQTLNILVTDNAGMNKETNATFSVDNDAPTLSVTSHADGDRVKGSFFLAGTTSDAPSFVGATSIVYKVTASETLASDEDWTPIATNLTTYGAHTVVGSNLSTFRVYFDDDVNNQTDYTHDRLLKKVLVSIPAFADYLEMNSDGKVAYSRNYRDSSNVDHNQGDLYKPVTTLYIHFKATDAYGNVSYSFRSLELDPQGDIPSVEITYPGVTAYGWRCATNSKTYYTRELLPVVGDSAYDSLDNLNKAGYTPKTITEINRTNRTIKIENYTYTYFGGETVQGGIVRVQGTAEDENAIAAVYIQIDPTYNAADGFVWTEGSAGNALLPDGTTTLSGVTGNPYPIETITTGRTGIKVGTSGAWSFSLNRSGEFNGTSGNKNYVGVRAIAKDVDGNVSPLTDVIVLTIDADTPRIGTSEELYLYQYQNNAAGTGSVTASQKYTDAMWLKGEWWLVGSVEDSNGIESISIDGNDAIAGGKTTAAIWNEGTSSETKGYILKFKIGSSTADTFGSLSYVIYAEDKDSNAKTVTKTISVNFDNKAPELAPTDSTNFHISSTVVQSNGFYTLGSAVTEAGSSSGEERQSGFDRLALYFVRRSATSAQDKLYDTYFLKSASENQLLLSGMTFEDGLYWKTQEVTRDADFLNTFTLTTADSNIHKGGMVKVGGAMYIITNVSGTTVTINGSPAILNQSTKKENVSFAMAMIVDHALTESNGNSLGANGYYTDVTNDDGDCMVEVVTTQGTTTFWEANINSRNIPDGTIEIHYVAFDKAGNSASGVVNGTVANNAPRLAGVKYGADNNGDGNITGNELHRDLFAIADTGKYTNSALKTSYVLGTKTVNATTSVITLEDPVLKVKGAIKVIPEIVGGNGALYYSWSVTKNGATAPYYSVASKAFGTGINGTDYSGTGASAEISEAAAITLTMKDLLTKSNNVEIIDDPTGSAANAGPQLFTFTIWDSTEGMTAGVNSQKAVLELVANVKIKDKVAPVPKITPFYWINKNKNSVYRTTSGETTVLGGHIELSDDLPDSFNQSSGVNDRDDKVSGAIVIEGTATDDTLLSGLYVKVFTGTNTNQFSFQGVTAINAAKLVEMGYTAEQAAASPLLGYYPVATYNGSWTGSGNYATNGWKFEIVGNDVFSDEGHTTHWKLTLNTEKLSSKVVSDLKVSVLATDMGVPTLNGEDITYVPNVNTASVNKTTAETGTNLNRFDVVPYIRSIKTSISTSAGEEFARSATGRYSVRKGESVKIYGWNLDTSTATSTGVKVGNTALTTTAAGTDTNGSYVTATIGSESGNIKVTVSGVDSLNNTNNNNAFGTPKDAEGNTVTVTDANYATYAYNRTPNGITNNRLTDDVSIWVWDFGSFVDGTSITSPMMKMDNASNWYMSYGKGTAEMYVNKNGSTRRVDYSWNKFHNTSVGFDSQGRLWAAAMNTDRVQNVSSRYVLYAPAGSNGLPEAETQNNSYSYDRTSSSKRHLEFAYNANTNNGNGYYDVDRVRNSKIITADINGKTYVAVAYYDGNNTSNPVKIRFGMEMEYDRYVSGITFTRQNSITTYGYYSTNSNGTVSGWTIEGNPNYTDKYVEIDGEFYKITRTAYYGRRSTTQSYYYTLEGYTGTGTITNATVYNKAFGMSGGLEGKLPDGSTGSGNGVSMATDLDMTESNDPSKNDTSARGYHIVASNSTDYKSGSHVAVGIVPDATATNGYVGVVAWYDANAKKLAFSYNTDPDTPQVAGDVAQGTVDQWAEHAFYVDAMYTGWYVDMAIDDNGGIHMAYYDSKSGDLKYAYMESYDAGTATVKTVDSYLSVGTNISMTIRKEGTGTNARQVPYIYYYNASATQTTNSVRVAWQQDSTLGAGAENDKYTGSWEVMTIPTEGVPVDATVCGGAPTSGDYGNKVVLGYMTDSRYERAVLQK